MTGRLSLEITEEEIRKAIMEFDFEFLANLIRHKSYMTNQAREVAADFVLECLKGNITPRKKAKIQKRVWYSRIAARVAELAPQMGTEGAINQARIDFGKPKKPLSERTVRTAWGIRLLQQEFAKEVLMKIPELQAHGIPDSEIESFVNLRLAALQDNTDRRLQKKS